MSEILRLHTINDIDKFDRKYDELEDTLKALTNTTRIPTLKMRKTYEKIVLDYCIKHKRKIYGGFAQNALIKKQNPKDAFYNDSDPKDIDIYSPEPIEDCIKIANIFFKAGHKNIEAKEATHGGTYSVFVEFLNVIDISYVPHNIYHKMPYVEISGVFYVSPHFTMIDMLKIFTDPYVGEQRWAKTFPRYVLLQKYSPFKKITGPPPRSGSTGSSTAPSTVSSTAHSTAPSTDPAPSPAPILKSILNFIKSKKSLILHGDYVYNHYNNIAKTGKPIPLTSYQLISTNYCADGKELLGFLEKEVGKEDIGIVEYYPFWTFVDYSCDFMYKGQVIVSLMGNNKRCIPIKIVNGLQFACYDINILMAMAYQFKDRVMGKKDSYYSWLLSRFIEVRNVYLKNGGKTMFDDTVFQQFMTSCIGEGEDPARDARLKRNEKAKKGLRMMWVYRPEKDGVKEAVSNYVFKKIDGNKIEYKKNERITLNTACSDD